MKKLALFVSLLAVLAFTGVATAATVDVTVGVPYIQKNKCDQVGNMSFEWDHLTTFTVGDQIQIGLVGQPTFCKAINMLVAVGDTANDASGISGGLTLATDSSEPLRATGGAGGTIANVSGTGVAFQVQASATGSTLLITVVDDSNGDGTFGLEGTSSVQFVDTATASPTELQLALFDEKTYTLASGKTALYQINTTTGVVTNTKVAAIDNTLCVNTGANYAADYVGVGISAEDKSGQKLWDFNPASPNIAIIKAGQSSALKACSKGVVGTVQLCTAGSAGQGGSAGGAIELIVPEAGTGDNTVGSTRGASTDSNGYTDGTTNAYTTGTHRNVKLIFETSDGTPFENATYGLALEIRVAPKGSTSSSQAIAGDNGFYFRNATVYSEGFASAASIDHANEATSACATDELSYLALAGIKTPATKIYDTVGSEITSWTNEGLTDCTFDATASKATKVVVQDTNIANYGVNTLTDGYLWVDIPDILYDPARVDAGDMVYVFATLTKEPCALEATGAIHVANIFDASTVSSTGTASNIVFPYFAEVAANSKTSAFYNGFTIANISTTATAAGTANLTIYEADGDIFTATISNIAPGAVVANLMSLLTPTLQTKGTSGDGVFGGQRCWMNVSANFSAAGTAQITNQSAGGVHSYLAVTASLPGGATFHN